MLKEELDGIVLKPLKLTSKDAEYLKRIREDAALALANQALSEVIDLHISQYQDRIFKDMDRESNVAGIIALLSLKDALKNIAKPSNYAKTNSGN